MKIINFCNYEWYVLEKQGGKMLLLAKDIITQKAYHHKYERTSWEKCTLRQWLNSEFYQTLEKCHANILDTETEQGVTDKIFLLSAEEVKKYNIPFSEEEDWWWLQSPDNGSSRATYVLDDYIYFHDADVDEDGAIRPAMWVDTLCLETV